MFCSVLCCIALYCIVLYCIALHCIVLYCIALYCIALHCIVLYCIVLYCIVLCCIVLYCIVNTKSLIWIDLDLFCTCRRVRDKKKKNVSRMLLIPLAIWTNILFCTTLWATTIDLTIQKWGHPGKNHTKVLPSSGLDYKTAFVHEKVGGRTVRNSKCVTVRGVRRGGGTGVVVVKGKMRRGLIWNTKNNETNSSGRQIIRMACIKFN